MKQNESHRLQCNFSVFLLYIIGILSITLAAPSALAWGHIIYLNSPEWGPVHLVIPALKKGEIKYCLEVDEDVTGLFPVDSIGLQIESIIRIWLAPPKNAGIVGQVAIFRTACRSSDYDLKVKIGSEEQYPDIGSYQIETQASGHHFTQVKIDKNYLWHGVKITDSKNLLKITDFSEFVQLILSLEATESLPLASFATDHQIDFDSFFWSTRRILLHEIGHSFGLCDTIPSQINVHCDSQFRTNQMNGSVMSDSLYLSLTKDDEDGIISLFKRFATPRVDQH